VDVWSNSQGLCIQLELMAMLAHDVDMGHVEISTVDGEAGNHSTLHLLVGGQSQLDLL
jgi:hypothetical protein